jgi:hypothetical protein
MGWNKITAVKQYLEYSKIIRKAGNSENFFALPDFLVYPNIFVLLVISLNFNPAIAGNQDDPAGGRSAGMSHASVTLHDGWSCYNNQAGLGYLEDPIAGFYFENRFNVREFSTKAGFIAYPFHPGTLALNYRHFGYPKYYESKIGLTFGRKLAKRFSVGVQVNFLQTHIADGYGNNNSVAAEIGILTEPIDNFFIGFHLFNPTQMGTDNSMEQQIPTTVRFGVSYAMEDKVLLACETVKDRYSKPLFRVGMEMEVLSKLFARLGFTTEMNHYSLGLGYSLKRFSADISFTDNRILGYTPQISVVFRL